MLDNVPLAGVAVSRAAQAVSCVWSPAFQIREFMWNAVLSLIAKGVFFLGLDKDTRYSSDIPKSPKGTLYCHPAFC